MTGYPNTGKNIESSEASLLVNDTHKLHQLRMLGKQKPGRKMCQGVAVID